MTKSCPKNGVHLTTLKDDTVEINELRIENGELTIDSVSVEDAGEYYCVVSNACGTATSSVAILSVNTPPSIEIQPTNTSECKGNEITLSITASGTYPLLYQWQKDSLIIDGKTYNTFNIKNIQTSDAGNYSCEITNVCGTITSDVVSIEVKILPKITSDAKGR